MRKAVYTSDFKWGELDEHGNEKPDPRPLALPAGFQKPESLHETIARLVQRDLSARAEAQGEETFEESEDFEIDDDFWDPGSPYEEVFDPVLGRGITHDEFKRNEAIYRQRFLEADARAHQVMQESNALRAVPKESGPEAADPPPDPAKGS